MKRYRYKARTQDGKLVTGIVEAVDQKQAVALLKERNLVITKLTTENKFNQLNIPFLNSVSTAELANFTRQLSTMISSGLSLLDAIHILESQTQGTMQNAISNVKREVESGKTLSGAMENQDKVFNQVYVSLVRSGEAGGVLEEVLEKLAEQLESQREFNSKVKGALLYPILIMIGMIGVMAVMLIFVIPQLSDLYTEFETELPIYTQLIITLSNFAVNYWWTGIFAVIGGFLGLKAINNNRQSRKKLELFMMSVPIFGELWEQIVMTTITRTIALLVGAGVPIVEGLKLSSKTSSSKVFEDDISNAAKLVEKGFPLAQAFSQQEHFPPLIPQMLAVGEETGKVDDLLNRISIYFQKESEQKVKNLTTAMEPLILAILGGGVGFLIFAIVMPIYNLTNTL